MSGSSTGTTTSSSTIPTPPGFKTGKGGAYETPLRDKTHGRIYRLVAKSAKPAPPLSLKDATPEKLVATLNNDNMFWRLHAQRLLVERGKRMWCRRCSSWLAMRRWTRSA